MRNTSLFSIAILPRTWLRQPARPRTAPSLALLFLLTILTAATLSACNQPAFPTSVPTPSPATTQASPVPPQPSSVVSPQATPPSVQVLYDQTTRRTPVIDDALTHPDNYGWDNYSTQHTTCAFKNGLYYTKALPGFFSPCYAKATNFGDFVFQAQITVISGHSGGLVFRANSQTDQSYQFRISTDGTYILNKFTLDAASKSQLQTLFSGNSPSIHPGPNHANLIAVAIQGGTISVFVNKHYIQSISDTTYQSGQIGVYVDSDAGPVEATFSKAQVWSL